MSSHHFVREGQEPALFVFEAAEYSSIQSLLEWAPFVLVSEPMVEVALSWGIRIDAVLLQDQHEENIRAHLSERQFPELVFYHNDSDAFSAGIRFLEAEDQHSVNVTITNASLIFEEAAALINGVSINLLESDKKWIPVSENFQKWFPVGSRLWIHKSAENQELTISGLAAEGDFWVAEKDGIAAISSPEIVWIGESI